MAIRTRPIVLGHRGYRAKFPENTVRAFREAMAAGAQGIECDLQKTKDGRYVIIHDPTTGRVADGDREVARVNLSELRSLDFGGGERIPTLEELLTALPTGAWLDLELKEETIRAPDCRQIMDALTAFPRDRLMISSFNPELLVPFRGSGYLIGLLVGEETVSRGLRGFLQALRRVRPAYVNLPIDMIRRLGAGRAAVVARLLRLLGFSLLFWTVNGTEEAGFAFRHGDIIVTDEVETIVTAVRNAFTAN